MYGQLPSKPESVSGKVERVDVSAFHGKATLSEVTIRFGPPELPPIHLMLVVPNKRTAPAPVILGMNYFGNHTLVRDQRVRLADNWMPGARRGSGGDATEKGHHKKRRRDHPELAFDENNGEGLCHKCHSREMMRERYPASAERLPQVM
jgi:hypothetical protein